MRALKLQFFLLFGSLASVQPYVALLFRERGMDAEDIGYSLGMAGWAIVLSPALITLIADTRMSPRRLVTVLSLCTGFALLALLWAQTYWALTAFYFLYSLGVTAMIPLQDGITFGVQKMRQEEAGPELHYNQIRVWGTVGYMALLVMLFYPIKLSGSVTLGVWFGIGCFALLAFNAMALPDRGRRETAKRAQGLPTSDALKALLGKDTLFFSASMFLLLACSAAYHTMYPVYLAEDLGLARHWVGIVIMSGALLEVYFIVKLSTWQRRWGHRAVMLAGIWLTILRFALMFAFPNLPVAIGTQVFHGAMICSMMVIPPTYINGLATESNRNSIQGVYTMLIIGVSRFVGTALSGHVASVDQRHVYLLCAALSVAALGFMWKGFRPEVVQEPA
ncbi:MFS transporter [Pelagicoccus sp. SDUM812003]|uniref:MFS transporter n=1 Tax=Pelagicoccus sp. SDUM812003 TaxID=3041267 RepID=UPI00280E8033|nr:MFS transporter [Pelagicoccus sp. SDUM812003]MDQ8202570.1 MFS transporter [Pelagicoccus sp. SDUM812003]